MLQATRLQPEQRVLLHGVSWETYERLVAELEDCPGVRMTYDRGRLELMSLSYPHDWIKTLLGRFVETMTLELGIPLKSGGSTTFKREELERGLEPDECYWIQSEAVVRRKADVDLATDPPPDLAIEVEIRTSAIGKLEVYAAIGIPEVWRHDGARLHILTLRDDGDYAEVTTSLALPRLTPATVDGFLARREELDETSLLRAFQTWVREELVRDRPSD